MNFPSLQGTGSGGRRVHVIVRNDESSASISQGQPCIYNLDDTREGLDAVLPSSSTAAKATNFFAGVALEDIPAGQTGKARIFGVVEVCRIVRQTRAASTNTLQTQAALAIGDQLIVNTVANAMSRSGAGAASAAPAMVCALETLASVASSATTTSFTDTAVTANIKAFVRAM